MKYIYIKSLIVGVLVTLFSCDVERFPYDSIDADQSFESIDDAKYWNNMIYSQVREAVYGIFMFSTDVQADQLNATSDYGNRNGGPHRWTFLSSDYTIRDVWAGYYSGIANINKMLEGFSQIPVEGQEDRQKLDQYIGEAHFARAFYLHNLVVRYAKMYNPSSASTDLGVPVLLVHDLSALPARATVKETYEQILSDIDIAKTKIANINGKAGADRFTIDAVVALEARVKLYMHDWQGAKTAAETLIKSNKYNLYNTEEEVVNMWHEDLEGEDIFTINVIKPSEMPLTNSIYLGYDNAEDRYRPDFIPSKWVVDFFDDSDFRKSAYFLQDDLYIGGTLYKDYWLVNKYPGNPDLWTSNSTNYAHKPKVFRIGEIYLIAAEASLNSSDEIAAAKYLNDLRKARGLDEIVGSSASLVEAIKAERFKELAFEGFRLDDLRRWNEGFERKDPQSLDFIQVGPDFNTKSVEAGNTKFLWGIPDRDRTVNTNIEQNEDW